MLCRKIGKENDNKMDKTFLTLVGIAEKCRRGGDNIHTVFALEFEAAEYGLKCGFFFKDRKELDMLGHDESDESVLYRAYSCAALFQDVLGEDVGSVVDMTREQHLELIRRANPIIQELWPVCEVELGITLELPVEPRKVLH